MRHLCDSNVLLAFVVANHPHHALAAFLAAFAMGHGLTLVTFDRGFESYRKQGLDLLLLSARAVRK